MKTTKLAFIGGGNMAGSMLGGLLNAGWHADHLAVGEPCGERRGALSQQFGDALPCFADNAECAELAGGGGVVVLAVKPQVMGKAVESIAELLRRNRPLIISIAAGIPTAAIGRWVGGERSLSGASPPLPVVRAMPNTPALVGAGMTGLFATAAVTQAQRKLAQTILESVGKVVWVKSESQLDTITAISGSGPAYFFRLIELLADNAVAHGLDETMAREITVQTALGAATLADQTAHSPAELRRRVTSPGGTTEAALTAMQHRGLEQVVGDGVAAAVQRSQQLAKQFGGAS